MDLGSAVLAIVEAGGLTQANVWATLRAALRDAMDALAPVENGYSPYAYVCDVIGTDESGMLVYEQSGRCYQCSYTIAQKGKTRTATLGISKATEVWPRTVYDVAGETVLESAKRKKQSGDPFILVADFCDSLQESAVVGTGPIEKLVKIISPGQGSSCFYPAAIIERDGPKVFKAGTHMYMNHPTAAEESARPEGDHLLLAASLSGNSYYDKAGPKGEGLYAKVTIYSNFAQHIMERAPVTGVSIRAYGEAETIKGKLTLKSFTSAESVDFVTKPGAGGAVLTEAARTANQSQETTQMDKLEVQALIEAAVLPINAKLSLVETENAALKTQNAALATTATGLREATNRAEARSFIAAALAKEDLPGQARLRVADTVLAQAIPVNESGAIDTVKLQAAITEAVKVEAQYISSLTGGGSVTGFGPSPLTENAEKPEVHQKRILEFANGQGADQKISEAARKAYATGRAS